MLTKAQAELLAYIKAAIANEGVSPSFDEMREALALKSKSGVHRLLSALEERGFIRRLPNRARAIEVLSVVPGQAPALSAFSSHELLAELKRRSTVNRRAA